MEGKKAPDGEEVEVTVVISADDFKCMMVMLSRQGQGSKSLWGRPLIGVKMLRAVEGDEGYNLHMFEEEG